MAFRDTDLGALMRKDPAAAAKQIRAALKKFGGNATRAAKDLGVHGNTLRRWIVSLELERGLVIKRRGPGKPAKQAESGDSAAG